jgi:hypothetical protein
MAQTRVNANTKAVQPPGVTVTLQQASFGLGLVHDSLVLEAERVPWHVSPPLILHLVESLLGYARVHTDVNVWQFRRDAPLKKM